MGAYGQTYNRGAHHRVTPASNPRGRAAEIAARIEAAGPGGITQYRLAAEIGCQPCQLDAMLASVTPRYPAVAEDDSGRLCWVEWDDDEAGA